MTISTYQDLGGKIGNFFRLKDPLPPNFEMLQALPGQLQGLSTL